MGSFSVQRLRSSNARSFIRKYGVKIVHNPKLCQQLGVFSKKDDVHLNEVFLEYLEKNYLISTYQFNDINQFLREIRRKKNFYYIRILMKKYTRDILPKEREN